MTIDFYDLINEKVRLKSKQEELISIFESDDPGHYQKLYFCGFLLNALKVTPNDLLDITSIQSAWLKKNPRMHYNQIKSVIKSIKQFKSFSSGSVISDSENFLTHFDEFEITEKTNTANTVKKYAGNEIKAKRTLADFDPKNCQIGSMHVTCYFKKCNQCSLIQGHYPLKNIRTGGEKNG